MKLLRISLMLCLLPQLQASVVIDDESPIVLVHPHGAEADVMLKKAAADYFAETGNVVEIRKAEWGDLLGELLQNLTNGHGGDIVAVGNTWASDLYENGLLTPLTNELDAWRRVRKNRGDITRDLVRNLDFTYMFPDRNSANVLPVWHVLPLNVDTRVFFYRKDLFRKYLRRSTGPITIDEAIQFGATIAAGERASGGKAIYGWGVPGGGGSSEVMQVFTSFVMGNGSSFIGAEEKCTFETPEFQGALKSYTGLYGSQHNIFNGSSHDVAMSFQRGEMAEMVGATWLYDMLLGDLTEDQVGVSPLPAGPVGPFLFQGGSGWALPSWVPEARRARAWDFVEYFMEPQRTYLKDIVFGATLIPAYESVIRVSRLTVADAVEMGQLFFYAADRSTIPLTNVTITNPGGASAGSGPENLLTAAGDWVDFNKSYLVIDFGRPTTVAAYGFLTGSEAYERDPTAWTFDGYDEGTGGWVELNTYAGLSNVPLQRRTATYPFNLTTPATYSKYRFLPTKLRGSVCGQVCQTVLDQLAFAVPLNYPQRGFYKTGRIEANHTVQRMVERVYSGQSTADAAAQACRELAEVLWDPPAPSPPADKTTLILVTVFSAVLALLIVVGITYRYFIMLKVREQSAENAKLRSDNEMAEDLARAVAVMELDKVQYLFTLKKPNRIQTAFILIVSMLKEYRAYIPAAVLDVEEDEDMDSPRESARRESTTPKSADGSEVDVRARERALEVGVRIRKGTVLRISIRMSQLLKFENFDTSTHWLETVLGVISAQSGIPLYMRADSMVGAWNAHKVCPKHALWATQCALILQSKLHGLQNWWSMGLSSGTLAVGHLGSKSQKAPFVTGVPLKQVEAIASLSMKLNARILGTDSIVELVSFVIDARPIDAVPSEPYSGTLPVITIWEIIGMNASADVQQEEMFRDGWVKLRNCQFNEAALVFTEIAKVQPDYQVIRLLKIAKYASKSPDCMLNDGVYCRKLEGWSDYEDISKDTVLPSRVPNIENAGYQMTMDGEPNLIVQNVPDSTNLRDEVEKERVKQTGHDKLVPHCPKDDEFLRITMEGMKAQWTCAKCSMVMQGKKWLCTKCNQSYCTGCFPVQGLNKGKLGREIVDRQGVKWHRSETILGKGAYGTVWLAMESGGLAAMKTVKMPESSSEVNSLLSEVDLLAGLRHENIVAYLSSCLHNGHIVICMEYVSGGSISTLLEQFGPALPVESVKRYLKDILLGLHFLHQNDIVHRDLKPGNVLLMIDGQCKLSDFGTSTRTTEIEGSGKKVVGTPLFMSPEACRGVSGKEVDVWSLGITIFQMVTGDIPYPVKGYAPKKFLVAVSKEELLPQITTVQNESCKSFIAACLIVDPKARPSTSKLLAHQFLL